MKDLDPVSLIALLQEFKSTKNWLLIEQKKCENLIDIAHRDWAITTVDVIINKIMLILKQKGNDDLFGN